MWLVILYYYTLLCFNFTSSLLLHSPRDKLWFNLIITRIRSSLQYSKQRAFTLQYSKQKALPSQLKSFQLKCISLIKLTSNLTILFLQSFFTGKRVWNEWQGQCTKKEQKGIKGTQKSAQRFLLLYWYLCL